MKGSPSSASRGPRAIAWTTPRTSITFQAVRNELVGLGHDGGCFDRLAFSLGLLPTLAVHGPALQRVAEIFATPVFSNAAAWTKQAWISELPAWQALLTDWAKVRRALGSKHRHLEQKRRLSLDSVYRHPLLRHGIDVAPLVSVLVVRHPYRTRGDSAQVALSHCFDHLQAMLTAASVDYRWASGATVDEYLDWLPDSRREFSSFPIESHRACRTVRWLSEVKQAPLLRSLGQSSDPKEFVRDVSKWAKVVTPTDSSPGHQEVRSAEEAKRHTYPAALDAYFNYWSAMVTDGQPAGRQKSLGQREEAPGGNSAPDGQMPPAAGKTPKGQSSSSPSPSAPQAGGDSSPDGGIAKDDDAPVRLPLVPVRQIDAILSGQKWRAMRAAMAATVTPFDLRYLAAPDADRVARHGLARAEAALAAPVRGHHDAEDALLALLTLCLGQSPAVLSKLRLAAIQPSSADAASVRLQGWSDTPVFALEEALDLQIDAPVLLVRPEARPVNEPGRPLDQHGHPMAAGSTNLWPAPVEAVAFLVPAIQPNLAGTDAEVVEGRPKQIVRNLLVPAAETGRLLWNYHQSSRAKGLEASQREPWPAMPTIVGVGSGEPFDRPTGIRLFRSFDDAAAPSTPARRSGVSMPEQRVTDFLNAIDGCSPPAGHERWSARLLQDLMPAHVEAVSGDRTLAWLLSCDSAAASQARMYYTQHTLARIAEVWMQAMHSAGLGVLAAANDGRPPVAGTSSEGAPPEPPH